MVTAAAARMDGDATVWASLPRHYVAYLVQPAWSDFVLIEVATDGGVSLHTLEVAVLRDLSVFSRDWKTGEFLEGKLRRWTWSWT